MSTGQIALSRYVFRDHLLCRFAFSPRSRLSVRCLVFKELFVAAVATTRPKFYINSFRLVKSLSKVFFRFCSPLFQGSRELTLSIKKLPFGSHSNSWLRREDLNLRPSGYEPDELPDCSTPRSVFISLCSCEIVDIKVVSSLCQVFFALFFFGHPLKSHIFLYFQQIAKLSSTDITHAFCFLSSHLYPEYYFHTPFKLFFAPCAASL